MKITCISNVNKESNFNVEIGKEYIVYSMIMWDNSLDYLIIGENSENPSWYPAELFKITNPLLPFMWYFTFDKYKNYKGEDCERAVSGYKEMVCDSEHHISIIEEKPEDLKIFFKRKKQIDEFHGLCKISMPGQK